ncbi:MarR family winged helix-turn-helix transcriptional regulator [Galbibacter sp.]|jgi:DNA-binding MarR family transcriptional regulator|uniref:MarR family winged helix-turn-helix transcriptional regulator n=1 Tax=Galbibacter sp. TaxID=2918471 RepID=UPI003A9216EC
MIIEDIIKSKVISLELKTVLNLLYTANLVQDRTSEVLKSFDLSTEQFNVLRILRGQKGVPASLSCVQERMICKMSNTTRLVDKLIVKGMVQRSVCEKNRRKVDIVITPRGMEVLEQLDGPMKDLNNSIIDNLSVQETEMLNTLLDKIRD